MILSNLSLDLIALATLNLIIILSTCLAIVCFGCLNIDLVLRSVFVAALVLFDISNANLSTSFIETVYEIDDHKMNHVHLVLFELVIYLLFF
jgi:hypothetical protein